METGSTGSAGPAGPAGSAGSAGSAASEGEEGLGRVFLGIAVVELLAIASLYWVGVHFAA